MLSKFCKGQWQKITHREFVKHIILLHSEQLHLFSHSLQNKSVTTFSQHLSLHTEGGENRIFVSLS